MMATKLTLARFPGGDSRTERPPIHPPWALEHDAFLDACSRCGACITDCPEYIIETGPGGVPQISFFSGACTFCGVCVDVCHDKALVRWVDGAERAPWTVVATIGDDCLAQTHVECAECAHHCEQNAIRLDLQDGGAVVPVVDATRCTGCGACLRPCPGNAIMMRPA